MPNQTCPQCKSIAELNTDICTNCYFPFNGTEKEKAVFIATQIRKKSKVKDAAGGIKAVQVILGAIAFFDLIGFLYLVAKNASMMEKMFQLTFIVVFSVCAFTIKKYPVISIAIPLSILSLVHLATLILVPELFFNGLIWKLVILIGLVYGLASVIKSKKLMKESAYLAENGQNNKPIPANNDLLDA